jgi:hypothetical protein
MRAAAATARGSRAAAKRVLWSYNGRVLLGRVQITQHAGAAKVARAWAASGKNLGRFKSERNALLAVDRAAGGQNGA